MNEERWLPVVGYEGLYEVSDHGRVRSVDRYITNSNGIISNYKSKSLKPYTDKDGYLCVVLSHNSKLKGMKIHRLVLMSFAYRRGCDELETRHRDNNRSNNLLSNLHWGTHQDNADDRVKWNLAKRLAAV